jgi:hypothetical protein
MLIDFDSQPMPTRQVQVAAPPEPVKVVETISVVVGPSTSRGYLMKPDSAWTWSDLRDYVVAEIERCSGTFPRNQRKEQGIFSRFIAEFGPTDSAAIARHAFEVCNGWWGNAPISVNRFCRASDDFFSRPILARISA